MQCGICAKEMPGAVSLQEGVTICGSCIRSPLPSPSMEDLDKSVDGRLDLSFLDDKNRENERQRPKAKSQGAVQMGVRKLSMQLPTPKIAEAPMKMKLKSNQLRDRVHIVEGIHLHFDRHGVAEFPAAQLPVVQKHMRLRPNRFSLVKEEVPAVVDAPKKDPKEAQMALDKARAALQAAREVPVVVEAPSAPPAAPVQMLEPMTTLEADEAPAKKKSSKKSSMKSEES